MIEVDIEELKRLQQRKFAASLRGLAFPPSEIGEVVGPKLDAIIARLEAAQAKIDALMLEYCPDEMTPEQLENWGKCQRRVSPEREAEIERALSK